MGQIPTKSERDGSSSSSSSSSSATLTSSFSAVAASDDNCAGGASSGLGLIASTSSLGVAGLAEIGGQVARQTRSLHQLSTTSYPEFLASVLELNAISEHFLDSNGKQLVFAVKKGSDSTFLWKATVRVACVKVDSETRRVDSCRCLSLKQYLKVYNALKTQSEAVGVRSSTEQRQQQQPPKQPGLLEKVVVDRRLEIDPNSLAECCICLERKPDVILPCTHSYCLPCIEQWNVDHKTCPVCRETLDSTDDGWIISEGPDALDVATEIQKSLMNLAH